MRDSVARVGFVCTNFNNCSITRTAVESLGVERQGSPVPTVIVDNCSDARDRCALIELQSEHSHVEILFSISNIGYFAGLNLGIKRIREVFPQITHLIVGNNDLTFPPDFAATIDRHSDIFHEWAVVAPDIVTPDGTHQNPHVRHPIGGLRRLVWDLYYSSYPIGTAIACAARVTRRLTVREENAVDGVLHRMPGPIEQGYGACFVLGPKFFAHFEGLFSPTFIMHEEFFLSEQLKTIGQATYYDPRFVVHHVGHATTHLIPNRKKWELAREAHQIYKRYLALPAAQRRRLIACTEVSDGCR